MLWDHRPGRNRFAGIVLQEYSPPSGAWSATRQLIFEGTPIGLHRGAAPLQARRLLLPADGRGRHRLGPRRDDGAVARADGPLRAASRHLHPDARAIGPTPRCSAPATPTWSRRRAARPSSSTCAAGRFPTAAAARWDARRRFSRWSWGPDGWLRTTDGQGAADGGRRRAGAAPAPVPDRAGPRATSTSRDAADRLPVAAHRPGPTSCSA